MSKVIKGAVWKDNPLSISVPEAPPPPEPEFDPEAQTHMLAEIAAKEQRASDMLKEAQVTAAVLREKGENDAKRMIEEAQAEIERLKEEAQQQGRREGYEAGHADGEVKIREELTAIINEANAKAEKTLRDAKAATRDYVQNAEEDIVTIAMKVVEKILPQHFIDVPQVVLPLVKESLLKVKDQKELIVHVAPDYYDIVLLARDEFRTILTYGDATIEVVSDEAMKPGDCLVETPNGSVDARLATRIEMLKQAVRDVML